MTHALAWLHARPPEPVVSVTAQDRALRVARLDGLLLPTGRDRFAAADLVRGPDGRAASLAADVPAGAAIARASAVWVHTGCYRPAVPEVVVPRGRREHLPTLTVHQQRVEPGETVTIGGVLVTTLVRTAVDLARWCPLDVAAPRLRALAAVGLPVADVTADLDRHARDAYTARARAVVAAALTVPGGGA
ncbi:hypothetical protein V2J56_02365 [Georgenia sp. MJ206]|uniref:hypothetical protein n=1 Tax=Georgenia wangjunii TaxID=3117730 RepID=UPI002F26D25A